MKNFSLFIVMAAFLASCTDSESMQEPSVHDSKSLEAALKPFRTPEDAVEVAMKAIDMLSDVSPESRGNIPRHIDSNTPLRIISSSSKSRSGVSMRDTLMYVVNYADSMGFALVSAVPNTPELIAVTVSGVYNPDESCDNPGFNMYIEDITTFLSQQLLSFEPAIDPDKPPFKPVPQYKEVRDTTWFDKIDNRIRVYWGQSSPEGWECSNGIAGCSNTAVAMLMSYFEHPKRLTLTYKEDGSILNIDWAALKKHNAMGETYKDVIESNCYSYGIHTSLAALCRELGKRSGSTYLTTPKRETSTPINGTIKALRDLGYSVSDMQSYVAGQVADILGNSNSVLLMYGADTANDAGAHLWVCDAVKRYKVHTTVYERNAFMLEGVWKYVEERDEYFQYNFYNWGWGAYQSELSGYFWSDNFKIYDNHEIKYNFNSNVSYIKVML